MTEPAFAADVLDRLRREIEVDIETHPTADAPPHRTIIWVVVDDRDRVFVRSYRGAAARWYREATSGTPTALVIGGDVVPVTLECARDEERIRACSVEIERKYASDPATPAMVRGEVLDTTLELHPRLTIDVVAPRIGLAVPFGCHARRRYDSAAQPATSVRAR